MIEKEYLHPEQLSKMLAQCLDAKNLTLVVPSTDHGDALLEAVIVDLVLTLAGYEAIQALSQGGVYVITGSAADNAYTCNGIRAKWKDDGLGKAKRC